jgi:uncharacterized repeat protein (TIGR01451 family)
MVRRILLVLGMLLSAAAAAPSTRGQDGEQAPPPVEPTPAAPLPPANFPADFPPPVETPGTDLPAVTTPHQAAPDGAQKPKKTTDLQPASSDPSKSNGLPAPPNDDQLFKAQSPAPGQDKPPAAPTPAGRPGANPDPDTPRPAVDRLPVGKQSVAVTVDVQAPPTMNLHQDATLKLIVRNTGTSDALNLLVDDELPDGLQYVSSSPEMHVIADSHLNFRIATLPAGSERVISIKVKPTKTGPFDHTATVRFETGCKSRTRVLEPKLKVDVIVNPTVGKVLKGQPVEFRVAVTNTGDGPARNVSVQAKLSEGLRHDDAAEKGEYETSLPELAPGQTEKLDALVADALVGGDQSCTVTATSGDVVFNKDDAECTKKIAVVEPKLKLTLDGPESRYTDTVADYKITVENPGTAPARKLRILATLPVSGRLVKVPPEGRYDATTRRLSWSIDQLEPGSKPVDLPFSVRMGGIGSYDVIVEAVGEGLLKAKDRKNTDVIGMPDVDLVVSESKRVLDVGGTTMFQIRLRNYGTKEATNLLVMANLSTNLTFVNAGGGGPNVQVAFAQKENAVKFDKIDKLGPGKELILGVLVKAASDTPKLATCRVFLSHDDLTERLEDMAGVKVTKPRQAPVARADGQ